MSSELKLNQRPQGLKECYNGTECRAGRNIINVIIVINSTVVVFLYLHHYYCYFENKLQIDITLFLLFCNVVILDFF